ncbi:hypothetical protein EYR41_004293 [Orbilia oligospora]|uniref:Uncharacterized protein n=1 Tax=Orbilia oligospora TaxID=2813651 RepID=A0A8H2E6P7_ORBOL|nr:hypothetical protein EYR41_004293 [Orbilia oligospora]
MNVRWAYYLTGTIVPLRLDETYAYFSVAPDAELSLEILGNAELKYPEKRVKIIDTLSYPGLSVKGIAAVGPTLDLWGSMAGKLTISGKLKARTKTKLPQYEMYYPMDQTAASYEKVYTLGYQQGHQGSLIGNLGLWMNERVSWKNEDDTNEQTWVEWIKWDNPLHQTEPVYKWLRSQGKRRTYAVGIFDSAHGPPPNMVIDPSGSDTTDWNDIIAVINLRGNSRYILGAQGTVKKIAMCVDHSVDTIPTPWGDKPNRKR